VTSGYDLTLLVSYTLYLFSNFICVFKSKQRVIITYMQRLAQYPFPFPSASQMFVQCRVTLVGNRDTWVCSTWHCTAVSSGNDLLFASPVFVTHSQSPLYDMMPNRHPQLCCCRGAIPRTVRNKFIIVVARLQTKGPRDSGSCRTLSISTTDYQPIMQPSLSCRGSLSQTNTRTHPVLYL